MSPAPRIRWYTPHGWPSHWVGNRSAAPRCAAVSVTVFQPHSRKGTGVGRASTSISQQLGARFLSGACPDHQVTQQSLPAKAEESGLQGLKALIQTKATVTLSPMKKWSLCRMLVPSFRSGVSKSRNTVEDM
ncbi:hypothetical protein OJAV_G00168440 [Oryzias javanicus]|uniref:Uncharacterized protein n=1 Tax=Oryzias javanicus TaxID=123683 RepID=A0A437CEE4_ORYJA|nr:hypothetical protein OJAV_G00168440 [Oryzias javanicus]